MVTRSAHKTISELDFERFENEETQTKGKVREIKAKNDGGTLEMERVLKMVQKLEQKIDLMDEEIKT